LDVRWTAPVRDGLCAGFVFAEVSNKHDGFVYLMVQDKRTVRGAAGSGDGPARATARRGPVAARLAAPRAAFHRAE
jgi:hypothetical protein